MKSLDKGNTAQFGGRQMAGDDLQAAFGAEDFSELAAGGQRLDNIGRRIVAKVLERVVFHDHLVFYLLDDSEVAVKLDE